MRQPEYNIAWAALLLGVIAATCVLSGFVITRLNLWLAPDDKAMTTWQSYALGSVGVLGYLVSRHWGRSGYVGPPMWSSIIMLVMLNLSALVLGQVAVWLS